MVMVVLLLSKFHQRFRLILQNLCNMDDYIDFKSTKEFLFRFDYISSISSIIVKASCYREAFDLLSTMLGDSFVYEHLTSLKRL